MRGKYVYTVEDPIYGTATESVCDDDVLLCRGISARDGRERELRMIDVLTIGQLKNSTYSMLIKWIGLDREST